MTEAISHACWSHLHFAEIVRIEGEDLENPNQRHGGETAKGLDAIVVPGGFGKRGFEGKIQAIRYAREHDLPFLGLCLGMQAAAVEFARHVCGLKGANSTEMDPKCADPVISLMEEQESVVDLGGTMRLGRIRARSVRKPRRLAAAMVVSRSCTNAIAIALNSTVITVNRSRLRGCTLPVFTKSPIMTGSSWSR